MGAGGIGALAFIGFALIAFFAFSILGVSLVVIGSRQKTRDGSTGIFWTGTAIVGVIFSLIVGIFVLGAIKADPGTVRFDLREPITATSVGMDPEHSHRIYDSEHVELTLPDGTQFNADISKVSLVAIDDVVTRIYLEGDNDPWSDAVSVMRDWAGQLDERSPCPTT